MSVNLESIALACARECERQQVGVDELRNLLAAYQYAQATASFGELPRSFHLEVISQTIEPVNAVQYRRTPVTVANGGASCPAPEISATITRMLENLDEATDPDEWVRALLQVHPWRDGNGRVAFIIYNWLKGTLEDPLPLPDYFGEKVEV